MKLFAVAIVLCCSLSLRPASASEFYSWTDKKGVSHFATSYEDVPVEYRDQVQAPSAPAAKKSVSVPAVPEPAVEATRPESRSFEIPYDPYEGTAHRVIIPVKFNDYTIAPMALDTGSPGLVISFELAEKLGVFSRDKGTLVVEAAGIGGSAPAILTIVDSVAVESARSNFVPTTITEKMSDEFDGLIGMDFLTHHTISIDSHRKVLVFTENPSSPDTRGGHDEQWWRQTFKRFRSFRDRWADHPEWVKGRVGSDLKSFLEFQVRESDRLLRRLENHASDNAVPQHWR